jgi:hypothetical protein
MDLEGPDGFDYLAVAAEPREILKRIEEESRCIQA